MGCHGGGHAGIGGIARDPVISPNDPAFWLTHGQLDRVYWIWQMLDFNNRQVCPIYLLRGAMLTSSV